MNTPSQTCSSDNIRDCVVEIARDVAGDDPEQSAITVQTRVSEIGDSLALAEILLRVEQALNITLASKEVCGAEQLNCESVTLEDIVASAVDESKKNDSVELE